MLFGEGFAVHHFGCLPCLGDASCRTVSVDPDNRVAFAAQDVRQPRSRGASSPLPRSSTYRPRACSTRPRHRALSCVTLVRDTGIEPVTSSVSGKRSPAELIARGPSWRWRRESNPCARLCRPLPHHSATPPLGLMPLAPFERMTGFEPATLTLAR